MKNSDLRLAIVAPLSLVLLLGSAGAVSRQQGSRTAAGSPVVRPAPRAVVAPVTDDSAESPLSLSDPDGQQLVLEQMSVRAAVQGMLSLTEMELRFRNPQARRIEGRFTCVLPRGASISRFVKEVNGQMMEGEVVERLRANQVYEQFLHQMRDPALLEQDQGNRFSARIFPIDPNGSVRLILSYSRLLPLENGVRTYEFPLRGMPKIGAFSFRGVFSPLEGERAAGVTSPGRLEVPAGASRSTAEVMTIDERDFAAREDIEVRWRPQNDSPASRILRAGDFYLAAFHVSPQAAVERQHLPWLFAIDTSASAADGAEHRIAALEEIFRRLPAGDQVEIVAFDQSVVPLMKGSASEAASQIRSLLEARHFLGGTDLRLALAELQKRAAPAQRLVIVSDGAATLGQIEPSDIASQAKAFGVRPVHALVLGSREDTASLQSIVSGRGRIVRVPFTQSMAVKAAEAAELLQEPLGATFEVADAAAEWLYPNRFEDVRGDTELIALAKVRPAMVPAPNIRGAMSRVESAKTVAALPIGTFEPLLEREAYRAYLEYLAERESNEPSAAIRSALATEQVKVSVEHRVVIPRTTMLVLETEWDYQRFGLDRRALAAILTVGAGGIERIDRTNPSLPPPTPRPRPVVKGSPRPQATNQAVPGGVEGGVEAGVVGGAPAPPVAETITVAAEAPDVDDGITAEDAAAVPSLDEPAPREDLQRAPAAVPPPSPAVRQSRIVTAPAVPRPVPPQEIRQKTSAADWTKPGMRNSEDLAALLAQLKANPRDREMYNQVSEELFRRADWKRLNTVAYDWQPLDPDNPQVYEMIGESARALGHDEEAARAFASLVEVAPGKTELLQRAALLLMRTKQPALGEAALRKSLSVRPDRVNGYRNLSLLLWQQQRYEEAARVLEEATRQNFPGWYGNVQRVIREELAYVYRDWIASDPARRQEILSRAQTYGAELNRLDALRVTLVWETDANDVDLHVVDPNGEEAFYGHTNTASGLELYEDITQGLGPEVIRTSQVKKGTYYVGVKYFSAGPMGVSRGLVVITRPSASGANVQVVPFRLVEGGGDVRLIAKIEM